MCRREIAPVRWMGVFGCLLRCERRLLGGGEDRKEIRLHRVLIVALTRQRSGDGDEPLEGQLLRLAQVDAVQLPLPRAVGSPIRAPTAVACPFLTRSEAAMLTAKGEGGGGLQPGIPGGGAHLHLGERSVLLVGEDSIVDDGGVFAIASSRCSRLRLNKDSEQHIADVRKTV